MGNNKELQTRREFFKKASKNTLPFLGAFVLGPAISLTTLTSCGCDGCEAACMDNCEGGCIGSCQGSATSSTCFNCSSSCSGGSTSNTCSNCSNNCSSSCSNNCVSEANNNGGGGEEPDEISPATGKINGYEYVDLGLSVKWARYNMGASTPSGYGSYYIWGSNNPPIYNLSSGDSICGTMYDNATQNWGQNWRMPTNSQINELINFCEFKVCILDGHTGLKATSKKNGNSIFLPFSGRYDTTKHGLEEYGFYWTGDVKNITQAIYVGVVEARDSRKLYISAAIADMDKCCIRPITTSSGSSSSGCSGSSCSSNCANNSTGSSCSNCASSCSSSCKTQCDFNCAATCKNHCGGSCNDSCGGTCTYLSAGTGCSGCARSCYNRCYTSCSYACSNNCESSCVHGSK